jgi:prevent-host-death family protein
MKKKPTPLYRKKSLRGVTTRDYIGGMKTQMTSVLRAGEEETPSSVVQEIAPMPGVGSVISVRAAKAHLSGLLEEVARGREIVITSDGVPKARLVPMGAGSQRKPFSGTREHLKTMPKWKKGDLTADEIIRADRDGRGW